MVEHNCKLNTVTRWDGEVLQPLLNMPMPYDQRKPFFGVVGGEGHWSFRQTDTGGGNTVLSRAQAEIYQPLTIKRLKHAVNEQRNIVLERGPTQELLGQARTHGHEAASQQMAVVKLGVVDGVMDELSDNQRY